MKLSYTAYLAHRSLESAPIPDASEFMGELRRSNFLLKRSGIEFGKVEFRFIKKLPPKIEDTFKIANLKLSLHFGGFLKVSIKIDPERERALKEKDQRENMPALVEELIYHSYIVLNLAKPGLYSSDGGVLYNKGKFIARINPIRHSIELAVEKSLEVNWPQLKFLEFESVWNWYFRFESELTELSETSIGRALNAFSHIFHDSFDESYEDILWVMIGLESLYCEGNSNLLGQLNDKSRLLLGDRTSFKKEFNKMYDYRSRFVHGDMDFQNKFLYVDSSDKVEKHLTDYWSARSLAIATLVATFQRFAIENWSILSFKYTIKGE